MNEEINEKIIEAVLDSFINNLQSNNPDSWATFSECDDEDIEDQFGFSSAIFMTCLGILVHRGIITENKGYYQAGSAAYDHIVKRSSEKNTEPQNVTYNINNPSNSIIGNQTFATINISSSLAELEKQIEDEGGSDKDVMYDLLNEIKLLIEENKPIRKGALSKFSDLISKHSWIFVCASQIIAVWLTKP